MADVIDVRRSADRFRTQTDWLDSRHSFSFGRHYDAANTSYALLVANNEDRVVDGGGFDMHPHRDMEIVTWVLAGSLRHEDSAGHSGVVRPGLVQRMSAGSGVVHSERAEGEAVHFVQMWVTPDETGTAPEYAQRDVAADLAAGGLVPVASGRPGHDAALHLRNRSAALHAARLTNGAQAALPEAPYLHLFVASGSVQLEGAGTLAAGDAARISAGGGQRLGAAGPAEILVWEMHAPG